MLVCMMTGTSVGVVGLLAAFLCARSLWEIYKCLAHETVRLDIFGLTVSRMRLWRYFRRGGNPLAILYSLMGETVGTDRWHPLLKVSGCRLSGFIAPKGREAVLRKA